VCSAFLVGCRQRQSLPNYNCPIQMQLSGQYDNVESTALAREDRADNSDVPNIQRESIRTRRERLHGMRVNIERTLAVGLSQELLNGFDISSIRLQHRRFSTVPAGNALSKSAVRERTLASLDAVTGLRVNELLALGRGDVNLENLERRVTRSIWHQVLGRKPRHTSRSSAVLNGLVGSESPGT
jgi:integrase